MAEPRKSNTLFAIILIVLIVAAVAFMGWYYTNKMQLKPAPTQGQTGPPSSSVDIPGRATRMGRGAGTPDTMGRGMGRQGRMGDGRMAPGRPVGEAPLPPTPPAPEDQKPGTAKDTKTPG